MDDSRRCKATSKRSGQRCKRAAAIGGAVCSMHGGKAPQVLKAIEIGAAKMQAHQRAQRMVEARAGVGADQAEIMLDLLYLANAKRIIFGQMVSDLDNAGELEAEGKPGRQRGWAERVWVPPEVDEETGKVLIRGYVKTEVDPLLVSGKDTYHIHPFVDEERHWIKECRQIAKDCITLGFKEREVRLAEQQGAMVVQLFRAIFADSSWSEAVRKELDAKGATVAARHLRSLESRETG